MTVTQPHGDVYTIRLYSQDFIGEICGQRKEVMILQKEEKKEGKGKVWNAWIYSPPNGKKSSNDMEIGFRSGPEMQKQAVSRGYVWQPSAQTLPEALDTQAREELATKSPHLSGLHCWTTRGKPRDRERGLHPEGTRDYPAQTLEATDSSASRGPVPCTQFCPGRRQHRRVDKGGSSVTAPNSGSLFLLQCSSLFSTASNLSPSSSAANRLQQPALFLTSPWCIDRHLKHDTPLFKPATPPASPHLCALEHQSPSCSDKTSKNYSWFLFLTSHIQPCGKPYWFHL